MSTYYLQQILSGLAQTINSTSTDPATVASPAPPDVPANLAMPSELSGLITFLFSFSALRDWLKLILIGGFFETCRRCLSSAYAKIKESMFVTAYFEQDDPSYDWMMVWLSKQPSWSQARDVQISTNTSGANNIAVALDNENESSAFKSSRKLAYLPSLAKTYSLWYKHRWMSIVRTQQQTGYFGHKEQTLHISILARSNTLLVELLKEARRDYMASQEHSMCIFVSDFNNNWKHVACRAKRQLRSVVLDPGIKELLLDDAQDFLESKDWYTDRGIPFRRGYLLYGAPGSGKTSLIHCLAGELNLDVYVISLSRSGLDDSALDQLVNDLPERCIALMEDIDAAFTHALNRETATPSSSTSTDAPPPTQTPGKGPAAPPPTSRLSLSGLLNALDGVGAQEGRILFATTNKYASLDPALCRPGRMDLHIEFTDASKYQAKELFTRFYLPGDKSLGEEDVGEKDSVTDSGYDSSSEKSASDPPTPITAVSSALETLPTSLLPDSSFVLGDMHKGQVPKLLRSQAEALATQFADAIPEKEFSMASLQGYLMTYKTRPFEAVNDASEWVMKQRISKEKEEKEAREKKENAKIQLAKENTETADKVELRSPV